MAMFFSVINLLTSKKELLSANICSRKPTKKQNIATGKNVF